MSAPRPRRKLLTPFNLLLAGMMAFLVYVIVSGAASTSSAADIAKDRAEATTSGYFATATVASGDVAPGVKIVASGPLYIPAELANADSANAPLIWYSEQTKRCFDFWARATEQGEPYDVTVRLVDCETGRPQ